MQRTQANDQRRMLMSRMITERRERIARQREELAKRRLQVAEIRSGAARLALRRRGLARMAEPAYAKIYNSAASSGARMMRSLAPEQRKAALEATRTVARERKESLSSFMARLNDVGFRNSPAGRMVLGRMATATLTGMVFGMPAAAFVVGATAIGVGLRKAAKWSGLKESISRRMRSMSKADLGRAGNRMKDLAARGAAWVNSLPGNSLAHAGIHLIAQIHHHSRADWNHDRLWLERKAD